MLVSGYRGFKKGYRIIFSFPSPRVLMAAVLLLALSQLLLGFALGKSFRDILILYTTLILATLLLYAAARRIFNFKRLLGLVLSVFLLTSPFLLSANGPIVFSSVGLLLLGVLAYIFVSLGASTPFFLASASIPLATGNYIAVLIDSAVILAILLLFNRIDHRIIRVAGVSGIDFLRRFFLYILADIKSPLENYLKRISAVRTVPIHVFDFTSAKDGRVLGRIVVSDIHPGPLRDLGSSTLPQLVMGSRTPTLYLKGPSTHSENLASSETLEKILGRIENGQGRPHEAQPIVKTSHTDTIAITSLFFGGSLPSLVFLDPMVPLEDLPYRLQLELEDRGIILVDSHSTISRNYNIISPGSSEYSNTLKEILNTLTGQHPSPPKTNPTFKVSFKKIDYSDGREVSRGGISIALLDNGEQIVSIVAIDGNNMDIEFKATLLRELRSLVNTPLVATTDTHVYSGRFTGVEYIPVGSSNSDDLREIILKGVKEASHGLEPAKIAYRVVAVKDHFISGEKLDKISRETEKNIRDGFAILALIILELLLFTFLPL